MGINQYYGELMRLAQGHNSLTLVDIEPGVLSREF